MLLEGSDTHGLLDFATIFHNRRPVEVEIGSGKGTFLLARAAARPDVNLLGIEWAAAYCLYAADRIRRSKLTNARMVHADAVCFISDCLAEASVWRVHMYFPDPWPKHRHHGRRSLQLPFAAQIRRVLAPGGQLLIVTDYLDYHQHIRAVLANIEGFAWVPFPQMASGSGELAGSNFERKYIAQGRPFYNTALMKYV